MPIARQHRSERTVGYRGYALVAVLWLITLLTVLTASYHASARLEARVLATSVRAALARARAEAALWIAVKRLVSPGQRLPPRSHLSVVFDGSTIGVSVVQVTGRINLNHADQELLDRLLTSAGVPDADRAAIVDSILDWRDPDHDVRSQGAEDPQYAPRGHGANDGPFTTVDELRHVSGMSESVFERIEGRLTVFGSHRQVSAAAADEPVLLVLSGGDEAGVAALLRRREAAMAGGRIEADGIDGGWARNVRGDVYTVTSVATDNGIEARLETTLWLPSRGNDAAAVFAWD